MKLALLTLLAFLNAPTSFAADCYTSKVARDAVRAVAEVSNQPLITDLVGGAGEGPESFEIWANYRSLGYSDHYLVKVDENECRVIAVLLKEKGQPVKEAE